MGALQSTSPKVLANKGVPVQVHRLEATPEGEFTSPFTRVFDKADEPVFDTRFVRMSNLGVADIEDHFGSLRAWQTGLAEKPFSTIVTTLSILWADDSGVPLNRRAVGQMLNDGAIDQYSTAIGAAFMLANGVDPGNVAKVIAEGVRAVTEQRERMVAELEVQIAAGEALRGDSDGTDSPSMTGSEAGADSAETSASSGG